MPKLVEIHNYQTTSSVPTKEYNWTTMNAKVFKKIGFQVCKDDIEAVIKCEQGAIERVLRMVQLQIVRYMKNPTPT